MSLIPEALQLFLQRQGEELEERIEALQDNLLRLTPERPDFALSYARMQAELVLLEALNERQLELAQELFTPAED